MIRAAIRNQIIRIRHVLYFTGSYPPLQKGLHRMILFTAIHPPFHAPYFVMASIAYSEQVGRNLQHGFFKGERYFRYPRIIQIKHFFIVLSSIRRKKTKRPWTFESDKNQHLLLFLSLQSQSGIPGKASPPSACNSL